MMSERRGEGRCRAIAGIRLVVIEANTARGVVVLRLNLKSDVASLCAELQNGLGIVSNRIASRATSMTSATEVEDLCRAEINRSFQSARTVLAEKWAKGA